MYSISGHCQDVNGDVIMTFSCNSKENINVNLTKDFPDYCSVTERHYMENASNIVIIPPPYNSRVVILDRGCVYRRASQFELDRYESQNYISDNAKMYCLLCNLFDI